MRARIGLIILAVAALPGCLQLVDDPVEVTYHRVAVEMAPWDGPRLDVRLALRPFRVSEALSREGISYRTSPTAGGYWSSHRWAESLGGMVQDALRADLEVAGIFGAVLLLENLGDADVILDAEVHRFGEEDRAEGWTAIVEATFELTRARGGDLLYHQRLRVEERCAKEDVDGVVAALSRALGRLFDGLRPQLAAAAGAGR